MTIWFTSDFHLGHGNIVDYEKRPFKSIAEMDGTLLRNWNSVVKMEDIVFHIGDFCFDSKHLKSYTEVLNGTKVFIKGNHDHATNIVMTRAFIEHGGFEWELIHDSDFATNPFVLCGHVHGLWKFKKTEERICVNVGVDIWDYKPIDIQTILKLLRQTQEMEK